MITSNKLELGKQNTRDKYTPAQVIKALTMSNGQITGAARSLGTTPGTVRRYIDRYPVVAESMVEYDLIIVELARNALMAKLDMGAEASDASIKIALSLDPAFQTRTTSNVHITGDPNKPVSVNNTLNIEGLSIEEKKALFKASKAELGQQLDQTGVQLDMSPLEPDTDVYSYVQDAGPTVIAREEDIIEAEEVE